MTNTVIAPIAAIINLKGKGKSQREAAYMQIAPLSFVEDQSRAQTISNLRIALGMNAVRPVTPPESEVKTAQVEWCIGRVASRMPASEWPKDVTDSMDKLEHARKLVMLYAAPPVEGKAARKLRAGQLGRRTPTQHKVIRASEEAWSLIKAELGIGGAQTLKERNASKATRATNNNPVRGKGKAQSTTPSNARAGGAVPTHSELVKTPTPIDTHQACLYLETQAATLLAFVNKHAKLVPTDYGTAVRTLKRSVDDASKARRDREAAADAAKAEKMK